MVIVSSGQMNLNSKQLVTSLIFENDGLIEADLKKILVCRAPTYPPKTGPTQKVYCLSENLFFFFNFSLILLTNSSLKS